MATNGCSAVIVAALLMLVARQPASQTKVNLFGVFRGLLEKMRVEQNPFSVLKVRLRYSAIYY